MQGPELKQQSGTAGQGWVHDGMLRFHVIGDIAHAAHFVTANWPHETTKPTFDTTSHPMSLSFRLDCQTIRDLQDTLSRASLINGPLAKSARTFRMLLASRLVGRVIPDTGQESSDSRAG